MRMHNPPHPGEVIRELCLKPLDLSVTEAASGLGVSRKTLSAILNGRARITAEMALRLARAFDTSLSGAPDTTAAECSCALVDDFLQNLGLRRGLADLGIPDAELPALAKQCMVLPDYQANPRIATLPEMESLLRQVYPARRKG